MAAVYSPVLAPEHHLKRELLADPHQCQVVEEGVLAVLAPVVVPVLEWDQLVQVRADNPLSVAAEPVVIREVLRVCP